MASAKAEDLSARIEHVRAECEAFIDAKAAELKKNCEGVPIGVLRQILTAKSSGCTCRAVLNIKADDEKNAAIEAAQKVA